MESSDAAQPNVGNAGLSRRALPSLQLPSASGSQAVTNEAAFTTSSQHPHHRTQQHEAEEVPWSIARSRPASPAHSPVLDTPSYERDLVFALEQEHIEDVLPRNSDRDPVQPVEASSSMAVTPRPNANTDIVREDTSPLVRREGGRCERITPRDSPKRLFCGVTKRPRDKTVVPDAKDVDNILKHDNVVAIMLYNNTDPDPNANDIWPHCRDATKIPARYALLDKSNASEAQGNLLSQRRPAQTSRNAPTIDRTRLYQEADHAVPVHTGRPQWNLPMELVELIAEYLNRDDIKSLRLVSHELNHFISQVIFKTVVVPFNTEIYGMLVPELNSDLNGKGKGRATLKKPEYLWNNVGGDEIYSGHGLDVFRGFGKHIVRFGMSFEVDEDSLAMPPAKMLTEKKTSFWGEYDWPFEEYRRFDTVAGLETAADETPRMKIAFSELTKVRELALSIDNGLGWLNGPDKSIRFRVLQRPPPVFGSMKDLPDRRAEAQHALWRRLESQYQSVLEGGGLTQAMLYRVDNPRSLMRLNEAAVLAPNQPELPYLDPRIIREAVPHDVADIPMPATFDAETMNRLVTVPMLNHTGALFSAPISANDPRQIMGPVIPANLTKPQKEWLLEIEWAQRAFLSSYMLSIVDNPRTFQLVHTLHIPRLPSVDLALLRRHDFWAALPNLRNLTLMVTPAWRAVHKDEAGYVETPSIDPTLSLDSFCTLLNEQIAPRPCIRSLTIGWTTGGENSEGLLARNKLLFPAPIWHSSIRNESNEITYGSPMLVGQNLNILQSCLLRFSHLEQLTLSNCWLTPHTLRAFVESHRNSSLKHLELNSVSLTAILRSPQPNANAAGNNGPVQPVHGAGGLWNHANPPLGAPNILLPQMQIPNQQQFLQIYLGALQVQLQQLALNATHIAQQGQIQMLQNAVNNQLLALTNANNQHIQPATPLQGQGQAQVQHNHTLPPNFNVITQIATQIQLHFQVALANGQQAGQVNPPTQPAMDPRSALHARPREGSWMDIIDVISPGLTLHDFGSAYSRAEESRISSLQSLEFVSCGYARLPCVPFDQTDVEAAQGPNVVALRNIMLSKRTALLTNIMQSTKWVHLAEIIQEVDLNELAALEAGWNLKTGWEDQELAGAVQYDGLLPGGSGRFSGIIRKSDRLVDVFGASAS